VTSSPHAQELHRRLRDRSATVAVVGLGYVGLPLVRAMHGAGFRVLGYDVDESKIEKLKKGQSYLHHLGADLVQALSHSQRFEATSQPDRLRAADAIILCVPSPLGAHHEPDMTYIVESTRMVGRTLRAGQLVSLESTTYPGTTRDDCQPLLDQSGLRCGTDYFLAFSPEREDPGRQDFDTTTIPKLVGGVDPVSTDLACELYAAAVKKVVRCDTAEIAEAAKLLENIYRSVNIALVNELKPVLTSMGIDIWKVIDAAATKPFGFQAFYPGPGLGGHCIPIDPFYLTWKAKEFGHHTRFIELAGEINSAMPRYVVQRTVEALNRGQKAVRGSRLLVVGIAYKPNVDDVRETPAAEIIHLFAGLGAEVSYHDPHVPSFPSMRKWNYHMESIALSAERLQRFDAVVVVTDHAKVDWNLIAQHAPLLVDSRNVFARRGIVPRGLLVPA
jgi:UDP-N-acetyl-D-glucosamine dehydrogenase